MIDTLTLQFNFTPSGNRNFYKSIYEENAGMLFPKSRNLLKMAKYEFVGGIPPYSLYYYTNYRYLNIQLCPRVILKRCPIKSDVSVIQNSIENFAFDVLKIPRKDIESITLNRIDYNIDKKQTEEQQKITYNLMTKMPSILNGVVKTNFEYAVSYTPKNGYVEIMTYNKEKQLESIKYEDYITEAELQQFKDVLRTEVRIKNRKINYFKYSENWGLSKELSNYMLQDMKKYFWHKYVERVWFSEPFYRIDIALNMIKQNTEITKYKKRILCDVLRKVNKKGYTRASEHYAYCKRLGKIDKEIKKGAVEAEIERLKRKKLCTEDFSTFRNYIKEIRSFGINPLTFDENFKLEKIENFAKYEETE